ncbi:X2-like carbohydrate binding domain-containing protein [Paenibacillus dendrobii]|uniref:X2-like carbohydrate binding domain-containing protein n=1 Tax=Paenibacillus dendrobii TaxID=2691084 RepID=UPI0013704CA5|nr:X2-like carbohydrate binding domain-containing protein [Paenibacillus dendrobii]
MRVKTGFKCFLVMCIMLCGSLSLTMNGMAAGFNTAPAAKLYVAAGGSDENDGSLKKPFATLEKARDAIRAMKKEGPLPVGGVTVLIRGGEYRFTQTFLLNEEDSGTAESPVTYEAYPGEKATLTGGITLEPSAFHAVSDPETLARIPQEAQGKVQQLDLKALGITDYGKLGNIIEVAPELFVSGNVMNLARWPNNGFATVGDVIDKADDAAGKGFTFTYNEDGLHPWKQIEDTWMLGYWGNDWATNDLQIKSIDFKQKQIESYKGTSYGMKSGQRFYFYNILEELDAPGEWYLDRSSGMLYLYPPTSLKGAEIQLSLFDQNLITMNGASNITFSHLSMEVSRGNAIDMSGGDNNLIRYCEISNMGGYALKVNSGSNNGIFGSTIYGMGNGAISLNGGDAATLTPAGNYADNNDISNYARIKLTYASAVEVNGVGNRATHNRMHNAPHFAIQFRGNDHKIEYNDIYDVVKETADASAIYSGRSFVWRGNTINYNYIHDIIASNLRVSTAAIYLDDYMSGVEMRGNVFSNIGKQAFKLANGRENVVENNIVINSGTSIAFMTRNYKPGEKNYDSLMSKFDQVPYQSELWSKRYPTLPNILNDEPLLPKRNVVRNNLFINSGPITGDQQNMQLGTFENNLTLNTEEKEKSGLLNPANGEERIKDAELNALANRLPEFKPIPFSEIGIKASGLPAAQSVLSAEMVEFQQDSDLPSVKLTLNGNQLLSVQDDSGLLRRGQDYVVQDSSVWFTTKYLSTLSAGYHPFVFSFNAGNDAFLTLHKNSTAK